MDRKGTGQDVLSFESFKFTQVLNVPVLNWKVVVRSVWTGVSAATIGGPGADLWAEARM